MWNRLFARPSAWLQSARRPALGLLALGLAGATQAAAPTDDWRLGAVLDLRSSSRMPALGLNDSGLQLGHSDLTVEGPLGPWLRGQVGAAVATHEGRLEKGIEEAFVETTGLPAGLSALDGLQLRAGRFYSQIGYLNSQHLHADDFTERPLLYRAFFGGHWYDDGLRLNYTLPTSFYWMVGVEALGGRKLVPTSDSSTRRPGQATFVTKLGDDWNRDHSWQLGYAYIQNRRTLPLETEDEHEQHAEGIEPTAGHDHAEAHGARYTGRRTHLVDLTWKWAPGGNPRDQQLRVTLEAARVLQPHALAPAGEQHRASALAVVWRFAPQWEAGLRADRLRVSQAHADGFEPGRLREAALMLAWKPSHQQSLRLQYTRQSGAVGFDAPSTGTLSLQYVMSLGAHGAHGY